MGRRWLGVKKRDYVQMPHAESWPESLWWFVHYPADRRAVIDAYLEKYAHGKKIPEGFRDELTTCLKELSQIQSLQAWRKPRTRRYWTIPAYARDRGLKRYTLMKWLRELEKIAKEKYPDRAEAYGRRCKPITERDKEAMRQKCCEGDDIKDIARQFRINPAHAAKICRAEMTLRQQPFCQADHKAK